MSYKKVVIHFAKFIIHFIVTSINKIDEGSFILYSKQIRWICFQSLSNIIRIIKVTEIPVGCGR